MTIEFKGAGVRGIYLLNGYHSDLEDGCVVTCYDNLAGLYEAIGRAIALSDHQLTAGEVKFIRKRLGKTQEEFGRIFGKTNQAVAKWEKEEATVSAGDGKLMRLAWLAEFDPSHLAEAARQLIRCETSPRASSYVFEFDGGDWEPVIEMTSPAWSQAATTEAISTAMLSSKRVLEAPVFSADMVAWTGQGK